MTAAGVIAGASSKSPSRSKESVGRRDVGSLQMPTHRYGLIERIRKAAPAADGALVLLSRQRKCAVCDRKSGHQSVVAAQDLFLADPHEHVDINQDGHVRGKFSANRTLRLVERIVQKRVRVGKSWFRQDAGIGRTKAGSVNTTKRRHDRCLCSTWTGSA